MNLDPKEGPKAAKAKIPPFLWAGAALLAVALVSLMLLFGQFRAARGSEAKGGVQDPSLDPWTYQQQPRQFEGKDNKEQIQVPLPPFSEGIFPCSACHAEQEVNTQKRVLTMMHENIVLNHGPASRWCLDCHNPDDRDKLRLASGELIDFKESYRLCGQCHGPTLRDFLFGAHGKRTGYWNGQKQYLLCPHCHNPHSPAFKGIKPMPPPTRPRDLR